MTLVVQPSLLRHAVLHLVNQVQTEGFKVTGFCPKNLHNDLDLVTRQRFQHFRSIGVKIEDDVHILELFAQTESLTISQITRLIKSSIMQRAKMYAIS